MYGEKPQDLARFLGELGDVATLMGGTMTGAGGIGVKLVGMVLKAGAGFAAVGKDPLFEVESMLKAHGGVNKVHINWQRLLDERFGRKDVPDDEPTTPSALYPTDPYEL